jgi:hypothetical protein
VFIKPVIERRVTLFKKSLNSKSQKEADGVNVHISYSLWDAFSPLLVVDFNNLFLEKLPMEGEAFIKKRQNVLCSVETVLVLSIPQI